MHDPTSEDTLSKTGAAVAAFIVLAPLSLFFMMWWGYGGYTAIAPAVLQSIFAQILIYLCIVLIVVQGIFFRATRTTRKGALYGFLSPWAILALITVPQFSHSPKEVMLILLVPALAYALHMFLEQTFRNRKKA